MKDETSSQNHKVDAGRGRAAIPDASTHRGLDGQRVQFQEIAIGGYFEFRGRRYQKLALNMASDEDRNGSIFMNQTEVSPDPYARTGRP